jgi:predicted  nucleic acid-binding Zn-ribbon protein
MNDMEMQFAELELRLSELHVALERVTEERDNYKDAADSLFKEVELLKSQLRQAQSDISRLRTWIAQGVEL